MPEFLITLFLGPSVMLTVDSTKLISIVSKPIKVVAVDIVVVVFVKKNVS